MPGSPHKRVFRGNELMAACGKIFDGMIFLDVESRDRMVVHRVDRGLVSPRTPFQEIDIFHAPHLGLTLALDGIIQVAQSDEHIYHELLVHPGCLLLSTVRSAIILGGGDGCAARELLKYHELESLELVEIDQAVVAACRTYFKEVNRGALDDPRVTIIVEEAQAYLKDHPQKRYDLIVLDLTDPYDSSGRPGELARPIFFDSDYDELKGHMNSDAILVAQTGGLIPNPAVDASHKALIDGLRKSFAVAETAYEYVRSFDQIWSITLASDHPYDVHGLDSDFMLLKKGISGLRHYDGISHRKAFKGPRRIRNLMR